MLSQTAARFSRSLTVLALATALPLRSASYHLDPKGDAALEGLTPASAWKSLIKANNTLLHPGDSLLL